MKMKAKKIEKKKEKKKSETNLENYLSCAHRHTKEVEEKRPWEKKEKR